MELGDRLRRWWDRLRGYEPPTARPVAPAPDRVESQPARPITTVTETGGTLKLSVEGEPDRKKRSSAGFDPYSSDGGFSKPRGWDNVNRK